MTTYEGRAAGECFEVAAHIADGDAASRLREWRALAERVEQQAREAPGKDAGVLPPGGRALRSADHPTAGLFFGARMEIPVQINNLALHDGVISGWLDEVFA